MDKIVATCGLVCTDCEVYIATQANDHQALERMAERAREEFGVPDASAESAMCDGCLGEGGRKIGYCFECEIRACGVERGIANCAHCAEYVCDKLEAFFDSTPAARDVLDGIRSA